GHDGRAVDLGTAAVAGHALQAEVLEVPVEDLAHVVGSEGGGNGRADVVAHPGHGVLEVEAAPDGLDCQPARLAPDDDRGDGEDRHNAHDDQRRAHRAEASEWPAGAKGPGGPPAGCDGRQDRRTAATTPWPV